MKKRIIPALLITVLCLASCRENRLVINPATPTPTHIPRQVVINTGEISSTSGETAPTATPIEPTAPVVPVIKGEFTAEDMVFTYDGTELRPGMDFSELFDKLGLEVTVKQGQACLDGGFDTNYYYDIFSVYTIASGGKQLIYDIYVNGAGLTDRRGTVIGKTTREEVTDIYGEPDKVNPTSDVYMVSEDEYLSIEYTDEIVTAIDICNMTVK